MKNQTITFTTILLVLACCAFLPSAQAVSPPPDGGYPNGNTAEGDSALFSLTSGADNTAVGAGALYSNSTGSFNTASGFQTLNTNNGNNNTATGYRALLQNTSGGSNTATGFQALSSNTSGSSNTAVGYEALTNSTGSNNVAVGFSAGSSLTMGSNNIDIGAFGQAADTNTIRIGKGGLQTRAFMQGIRGVAVSGAVVVVNGAGQLGVAASSQRFKDEIKPIEQASEAIFALKPVTFRYKKDIDPEGIPQFGLVAEDVAKVNPDLVAHDDKGEIYTVRYDAVNAMLLNEFLKEHKRVEQQSRQIQEQKDTISEFKKGMQSVIAQLKDQASQIQKVSSQVELFKNATQTIADNK